MSYRGLSRAVRHLSTRTNGHMGDKSYLAHARTNAATTYNRSVRHQSRVTSVKDQQAQMWKNATFNSVPIQQASAEMKKPSLVIFDKDGTLICFHSMWKPWLHEFSDKLCAATGLPLQDKIFDLLGYCRISNKFNPGLLAESTKPIIQTEVTKLLVEEGFKESEARAIVDDLWTEGDSSSTDTLKALANIQLLFKILKTENVKIAISTSDSRDSTMETLKELDLEKYVDWVVCGDDPDIVPKPDPYSANKICKQLGVDPADTVMVGDTKADVGMGKAADLGWNVGVLSGVGNSGDLMPDAHHIIPSVKDLLPLILPGKEWQQYYKYSPAERIMVEPHHLEEDTAPGMTQNVHVRDDVKLVIFDLHGTLIDTHDRYIDWVSTLCKRMEQMTGVDLGNEVYKRLGVNLNQKKLKMGPIADGTSNEIKSELAKILIENGLPYEESMLVINQTWTECKHLLDTNTESSCKESKALFKMLKKTGVKIAVNTSDTRNNAFNALNSLGLLKYVDMMVCGDDPISKPTPAGDNAKLICREFNVDAQNTVIVGDTLNDLKMGSNANVLTKIAVLTGAGDRSALESHADVVVNTVGDVKQHLFENPTSRSHNSTQSRAFSTSSKFFNPGLFSKMANAFTQTRRKYSTSTNKKTYDYIVVGAGSAGCVMANRLTESGQDKVLLMEAGPTDMTWKIWMPAALMYNLCDDKYNWYYHTEPEPNMNNRVMYWPRGRVWGGSSSLNAMVYIRGNALDYDRWEKEGATNWSYANCLPYFRKAQCHELGQDDYRGGSGPLGVSRGITNNPLHQAFIDAGMQAGYPFTDDMNGYQQEGVGWMDMTIKNGMRCSAAAGYLHPIKKIRSNLETKVRAMTTRVLFDGNRAVGIEYEQKGQRHKVYAGKEVILSGGAINSPQLLMLSGVGNADDLKKLDIPVVANLPGIGENLQDHLEVYVQYKCLQPITLYTAQWKFPHNMIRIGLQWFLTQKGWGATAHLESGGFLRSRPGVEHPDLQIHFLPSVVNDHGRKNGDCHAFQFHIGSMRSKSRGYLKLKSKDPKEHPKIVANYMSHEEDWDEMRAAITLSREIIAQKAFDEFRGEEITPGPKVKTKEDMDEFIRNMADSSYHPSCTCKMGQPSDPMAVVDPEAKVIGLENLRVIDASIMPSVVSGNLNGPTIMLAEKAADIVRGIPALPKSTAPVYRPKTLETQR